MIKGFNINRNLQYASIPCNRSVSKSSGKPVLIASKKTFVTNKIVVPSQKKVNASGGYF
jgi:hypothetical protein